MTFAQLGVGVTTNADQAAVELDGLARSALGADDAVNKLANDAVKLPKATKEMSLNTANIAAQFQDIAVTAQMGMSPLQIALQQGTQLSAALGNRGLTGTVQALGAAFMSVISPVSIITIGLIGLGAWGAQALGSILTSTEDATDALEEHAKWLDDILTGYEDAADAADLAAKRAEKLPQGVVQQQLEQDLTRLKKEQADQIERAQRGQETLNQYLMQWKTLQESTQRSFPDDTDRLDRVQTLIDEAEALTKIELSANMSRQELEDVATATARLMSESSEPAIRQLAADMNTLANGLLAVEGQAYSTLSAIAQLNNASLEFDTSAATEKATKAITAITRLAPELRSVREQAAGALNDALKSAPDEIMRIAARAEYAKTMAALDEQDARREAEKNKRAAARGGAKAVDQWGNTEASFQLRIDQANTEIELFGQGTFAMEKQKAALDLLADAKRANVPITAELTDRINEMATEYAETQATLEALQMNLANETPWETMERRVERLNELMAQGTLTTQAYAMEMAKAVEDMVTSYTSAIGGILGAFDKFENARAMQAQEELARQRDYIDSLGLTGEEAERAEKEYADAVDREGRRAFESEKALAIARAVLSGGEAIVKSYSWGTSIGGPIGGAIAAGLAAAATAAQIAAIAGTSYHSKSPISAGAGGSGGANAAAGGAQQTVISLIIKGDGVFTADSLADQLAKTINDGGAQNLVTAIQVQRAA